jgi:hypothetical protein
MIVMHNYDGSENIKNQENYQSAFWLTLNLYLNGARIERSEAFLTNYFMGLRPGGAVGEMASLGGPLFALKCHQFFTRQVDLINPTLVVVCGKHAGTALEKWTDRRKVQVAHPSSNRDSNHRDRRAMKWIEVISSGRASTSIVH